jgi:phage tail-like protein
MPQPYEFRLHITGPVLTQEFTLPAGVTLIGRESGIGLQLNHPLVSRRHAQMDCTESECQITDLDSANGVLINGEKLTPNVPYLLNNGTGIKIGPFDIVFEQTSITTPEIAQPVDQTLAIPSPLVESEAQQPEVRPLGVEPPPTSKTPTASEPPPPPAPPLPQPEPGKASPYLGLPHRSSHLLAYLPGIYHTDFMARFLALFESILTPIEWNVDNLDLFLSPSTAPIGFLPWLANWYGIVFDSTWSENQRRTLLKEASQIYARRGTRWALSRVLEIYTGHAPQITEFSDQRNPFTFAVKLTLRDNKVNKELIERIIDANKPAHTTYVLEINPK